ncbi:MAG: glycosyltransferase family 4 protein [Alphaproteobacteria bacterium]|nr:glycosyltransferase family 4 protein [Alphaproteobacteria bacterium]
MPQMRRILLVEGSGRGFLTQYTHALATGLSELGHDVRLVTGLRDELANWKIGFEKRASFTGGFRGWLNVARQVREFRPHVVHLEWVDNPLAALALVLWLKRLGIGTVYTPHNLLPHRWRWLSTPGFRALFHTVDRVVARDDKIAWGLEEILSLPPQRIVNLPGSPNFIACPDNPRLPLPELAQKHTDEFRVLFFGHGSGRKGLSDFLAALPQQDWPQGFHFVVAGEGVLRSADRVALREAAKTCRLTVIDRYIAPEYVAGLFEAADLMVMPYVKQCKSPLLDLAAAFKLPVLRSDRVEGAHFIEGVHGFTLSDPASATLRAEIIGLHENAGRLAHARAAMQAGEALPMSVQRLARGHSQLYANLRRLDGALVQTGAKSIRLKV